MTAPDPFAAHPELRDKITPPEESFFRDLDPARLQEVILSHGGPANWVRTDADREANRRAFLDGHRGGDLWVFGYGSLMWDPAITFTEVRYARLMGYARRMILFDTLGGRGTPQSPGLMAALDDGPFCDGLVFRVSEPDIEAETERLWRREMVGPGYIPVFAEARLSDGPVRAMTFVADHAVEAMRHDIDRAEQIGALRNGTGFLGTSLEYAENLVRNLAALGISDDHVSGLLAEARAWQDAPTGAD